MHQQPIFGHLGRHGNGNKALAKHNLNLEMAQQMPDHDRQLHLGERIPDTDARPATKTDQGERLLALVAWR